MMKKIKLVVGVGVAALLAGCNEEVAKQPEVRPVKVVAVSKEAIRSERVAIGDVRPALQSDLGFWVTGKLLVRSGKVGERVKKGDVIARLDAQDFDNKLRAAEAELMSAEAVLEEAKSSAERQATLLAKGVTTRAHFNTARKSLLAAEAGVKSAKASYALAADQLAYTELKAEFDGIVTATGAETGQVVNAGQMIVRLAPHGTLDAVFAIAEASIQQHEFAIRTAVEVVLLSDPTVKVRGFVREIAPVADAATRTYEVKVELLDPPTSMLFGASVSGHLLSAARPVMQLPAAALFDKAGNPAVWLVEPGGKEVSLRPVDVDRFEADRVVIRNGISHGDLVVVAGINRLRQGQPVTVMQE